MLSIEPAEMRLPDAEGLRAERLVVEDAIRASLQIAVSRLLRQDTQLLKAEGEPIRALRAGEGSREQSARR